MDGITDEIIVSRFLETGDAVFFEELVNRHIGKVRGMINSMVLHGADADDLAQEVFLKAYRNLFSFKGNCKFSTWLYAIAMNTVKSFFRKSQRSRVSTTDEVPDRADNSALSGETVLSSEMDAKIAEALKTLSPVLRAAITLTAINGMSVGEAAKVEGCLTATMYWRVHHARKLLKKSLEGYLNHE